MNLGHLDTVDVRTIWKHEANDFTPWLSGNDVLSKLGSDLSIGSLSLVATEVQIGSFSADIVAETEDGVSVLIENQLEQTDHLHLGQILTYLAGFQQNEVVIIWISTKFRQEHRSAVDWLNKNTIDGYNFFAVEVEVLRVGDSLPAPRFNVIASPNGWERNTRQILKRVSEGANEGLSAFYQKYWTCLRDVYQEIEGYSNFPKSINKNYISFRLKKAGIRLSPAISAQRNSVRVELYIRQPDMPEKFSFRALLAEKETIEREYGAFLDWQENPGRDASRIAIHLENAQVENELDWRRQHEWMVQQIALFRKVFSERIRALGGGEFSPNDDLSDLDE